jgi:hypothetical protein
VASVFELSEPYRNFLVSVLPPGRGVCATCWRAVDPGYRLCYPCRTAQDAFLGQHETHVAQAVGVPRFDVVTTVPGTRSRADAHPLVRIVGTLVGQTRDRYQPLLTLGPDASVEGRVVLVNRFRAAQAITGQSAVLLLDDTWTTGGRAQSAAIALRDAGAARVAVVVLGRHFDRDFGTGETYYREAKARKFTWDTCCLEADQPHDDSST